MRIRYDSLIANTEGQAPFEGVVLHAKVVGKKHHSKDAKKLIKEIIDNKHQGIVFMGDWTKQAMEFIEVLKFAQTKNLEILIYTDYDLEVFKTQVGQACYEKTNKGKLTEESVAINRAMLSLIGGMTIDYYIPNDYFIICGTGDDRQVCKIKKAIEDDTFFEEEVDNG